MKKCVLTICLCFFALPLFAQAYNEPLLTPEVLENFIANAEDLVTELELHRSEMEGLNAAVSLESEITPLKRIMEMEIPSSIDLVFSNHGFGGNGYKKFVIIGFGATVLMIRNAEELDVPVDTDRKALIDTIAKDIHPRDMELIKQYYTRIIEL